MNNPPPSWELITAALASARYHTAHGRVLRQLTEALLFERVLTHHVTKSGQDKVCFHIPAHAHDGHAVRYRCSGRISDSFGRIRLDAFPVLRDGQQGTRPVASLQEFMLEVFANSGADEVLLLRFLRELQQTLLKDTLALYTRPPVVPGRGLTTLEAQLQDGHPYHPCYKSRMGFDPLDNLAYGPEFEPAVHLVWMALRRNRATLAVGRGIAINDFLRSELGEAQHERFITRIRSLGLPPDDYLLLPAHPWQWREKIVPDLFPLLQRQDLIWLGKGEDDYRPLQSIRSLANDSRPTACQVKLPISIVNTSADRILSCHNVENAPPVSDWLCDIREHDQTLRDSEMIFLREVAGITYSDPSLPPSLQAQQYGMLGVIWRDSLEKYLHPDESAAPFSGLCQCEADGTPFIAPWIEQHGLVPWLDALMGASVRPLIHLLYAHGIGMEAHAQNIVLIHRRGLPCRVALKDLPGGLRFVRRYLADPERCPRLVAPPSFRKQANSATGMEVITPEEVRDYFHDAVFFINLGELSLFLRQHYRLPESDFWTRVAACINDYQSCHPELASRFACFDLFAPTVQVEQLARRRLFAENEPSMQAVPNPLHRYGKNAGKETA